MDSSDTPRTDGISASQETESSQVQQSRSRAKTDPAWVHGLELEALVDGKKKKWIRCMYCNELFKGGGIHRLKLHLAGIKGDVKGCPKVSAEVRYEMEQSVELFAGKKRPAMGYVFGALHCAIEEIEKRFQKKKRAIQQPVLSSIEARWDKHLNKNLHAAGFWFNPINQYDKELMTKYHTTTSGVIDVIERYAAHDPDLRKALTAEMRIFRNAEGDFGRVTAINDRSSMLPDEWWLTYGCSAPNLQKLAIRVLSQTCSASGCERNWSLFEHIHSKKRNRLEHQVMNDIAYVQCNSRLEQKSQICIRNYDPICLEDIAKFDEEWIFEEDPQELNGEEIDRYRKGLMPNDTEICNAIAMNDEAHWIDDECDMDEAQENDEGNFPTGDQEQIDGAVQRDEEAGRDDGYGDDQHHGNMTDWTFEYR